MRNSLTEYSSQKHSPRRRGALVISLDLELHWGVRDSQSLDRHERARLLSARDATLRILRTFEEFSVHATWAAVGFLFARSREELEHFSPANRPAYSDRRLDPYREEIGRDESDDPYHYAPRLIAAIQEHEGQEIGTHSFSHYYCREKGQGAAEFNADIQSAIAIAEHSGYNVRSYVFPRNQVNSLYLSLLARAGITSYRADRESPAHSSGDFRLQQRSHRRLLRLCDNYLDICGVQAGPWPSGPTPLRISASRYLRPYSDLRCGLENLRYQRIVKAMRTAALRGEVFHLWWHPEDFALNCERNLQFLRRILTFYQCCRDEFGMLSLSMGEVAAAAHVCETSTHAIAVEEVI